MAAYLALLDNEAVKGFLNLHPEFDRFYIAAVGR